MLRIIDLLEEKNHYLEKFYALNETELVNFSSGNFDKLEHFYNTRERILEIVKYIDGQLDNVQNDLHSVTNASPEERLTVRQAMSVKDEYVALRDLGR